MEYTRKIYYHDTDCGDVVYYANYLKILEEARDEYFAAKGFCLRELNNKGIWFVVGNVDIKYKAPARFNDCLTVVTEITSSKSASIEFSQIIKRDDDILNTSITKIISVDNQFKPVKIPDDIKESFTK